MSENQTTAAPLTGEPKGAAVPPVRVEPTPGGRLEQLHARYPAAKAAAAAAAEELKTITDAIKVELSAYDDGGVTRVDLVGAAGPALRLAYTERWTVDSRKLKAQDPETYVRYARKSGSWSLSPIGSRGGEG